ncbi:Golgi SNAP receptor complex member 1 isoform X2 [Lingula anatina]|uniref:Golgi SNAP receptor complex member 1 n=1 Tax=Lingula anatina TaxID=7574 RepID=A0A1S3IBB5_LINAN|nr:Golgi SNAP receptor complex member 1 isoform X2 [Lingula anatina]|eukprot:XP_013394699.1 Golgi SNAP receptor complex member 1 isoform X2 [Lingula anatina]
MADGNRWEGKRHVGDLRKQARQLENEIDLKLVSFSKLGTNYSGSREYHGNSIEDASDHEKSDTAPLLNKANSEHMFETMAMEIEQLLARLTQVNDQMAEYTQNISVNSHNSALLHTLQRHRDILQDYSHEFQKTKANITACAEREDLLGSVSAYKNATQRRTDLYLKENEHIRNSDRLLDEQISIAMATKENLQGQRGTFNSITQKLSNMGNRFPVINSLIQKVNLRKRRDAIILGFVIGICVVLLLIYAFH